MRFLLVLVMAFGFEFIFGRSAGKARHVLNSCLKLEVWFE
jgi:hypothetical protein